MYEDNYNNGQNYQEQHNVNPEENTELIGTKIKIIGVGGAGGNALNDMIESKIHGVKYVAINTDEQDLMKKSLAEEKISIGHLGAGGKPEVAKAAAEQKKLEIQRVIQGQDMVFIAAGMGGGTGSGAAAVVAEVAKAQGILTVAIVSKPFGFEGLTRRRNAEKAIEELKKYVDTLIIIPNQKLLELEEAKSKPLGELFKISNGILRSAVKGISELITKQGDINLDFSDVKSIMENSGVALFGFVESKPEESVEDLVERAISNPLAERDIKGAKKILVNITAGASLAGDKSGEITKLIAKKASGSEEGSENLIFGYITEERDNVVLSIIATGFEDSNEGFIEGSNEDNSTGKIFSENRDFQIVPNFGGDE